MILRFSLQDVQGFDELLRDVITALKASGQSHGTLALAGSDTEHTFSLMASNFYAEDHGPHAAPRCLVCDTDRDRRYAFMVKCLDGVERGPIGSGCLFRHVLGEKAGKRLGRRLNVLAGEAGHLLEQRLLLENATDYLAYLHELGFGWVYDNSELQRAKLSSSHYQELGRCKSGLKPIPLRLYKALQEHVALHQPDFRTPPPQPPRPKSSEAISEPPAPAPGAVLGAVQLSEEERQRYIAAWGKGLAYRAGSNRRALWDALNGKAPLMPSAHSNLQQLLEELESERERMRHSSIQSASTPSGSSAKSNTRRTSAAFMAALCMAFSAAGEDHVRRTLVRRPMDWAGREFPDGAKRFYDTGAVSQEVLSQVRERLARMNN